MTILSHSSINRIKVALFMAALTSSCSLLGMDASEGQQTDNAQAHWNTTTALEKIGKYNKEFDQSILDAINTILLPTGSQYELREISNRYMIRDIHDMIVAEYYDSPGLREDAQIVFDYLHNVQGFAVRNGRLVNRTNPDGQTILHLIAADLNLIRALPILDALISIMLAYGIDPYQSTKLYQAIADKDIKRATQLLANGANPNGPIDKNGEMPITIWQRLRMGLTQTRVLMRDMLMNASGRYQSEPPLVKAAKMDDDSFLQLLLKYGAYVDGKDCEGNTPLCTVISLSNGVRLLPKDGLLQTMHLVKCGANINIRNNCSATPLHLATNRHGAYRLIELLLHFGADMNALNRDGRTPLYGQECYRLLRYDPTNAAIQIMLQNHIQQEQTSATTTAT